jgi:ABC-type phosphate transport system permease subunit
VSDPIPRLLDCCSDSSSAAGPLTALQVIICNWAGEAKAEFKAALALAAIIVLVAITFLCNGVALVESLRQAVVNAQLVLRAD